MVSQCDVIALSYNRLSCTKEFIRSFFSCTKVPSHLYLIDNASTDGTQEFLKTVGAVPPHTISVICNNENLGFVDGMNQGIALTSAPYVCLANNDLIFTKGWLTEIISIFDTYDTVGIINPHSNNFGRYPPKGVSIHEYAKDLNRQFGGTFVEMPHCIGFCMVIRREVIEKVGGLSAEFSPFFFEDADYVMKAKEAGYLVGLAKGAYVWHHEHASVDKLGKEKERQFKKSKRLFEKKWGKPLRIA